MHSLLQTVLPPSGVEFAGVLNLNDRTLLVVARSNFIRVFSLNTSEEQQQQQQQQKLCLVRRHRVHGHVTGMTTVKIASSTEDKLLVSFKDSKLALLEWEEGIEDFVTVSIHTYERALVNTPTDATSSFVSLLRVDDESRCATLLLPHDQLAILPFVQHELDVDMLGPSTSTTPAHRTDIPYLPSFILSLPTSVDPLLQHVLDFSFLPGFTNPTLAVLCQPQQTWSGRLKEFKDTFKLVKYCATYIFEIAEVVPDRHVQPRRWYKLRLRYRDDAKGPVTALSGFNGYLVSSMGQKIFVRAFDSDERLIGITFLDVGIYVTSLRTLKNLLLIGDAVISVWFAAFQEDPYKLVILAKDVQRHCVTSVDFFFVGDQLAILAGDESGVMRVYTHDPTDPDSRNGQLLALRTEFNAQVEYRTSTLVARRSKEDGSIPQARLSHGRLIVKSYSVDDRIAKRLQLLQGQLSRNVQHIAGLNPRAHRTVRNEHVSKPLTKGIFDGDLLETLSETRQREITKPIGVEPGMLLKDWTTLVGAW